MRNFLLPALVVSSFVHASLCARPLYQEPASVHRAAGSAERRAYVFAVRQTAPPVSSVPVALSYSREAADANDSFNPLNGCFTARREGYYRITAQVTFPADGRPAMVPGACSLIVDTTMSPGPVNRQMRTGQYRRRLPCSTEMEVSQRLDAGQMACIRVSTSAQNLVFAPETTDPTKFTYVFSYLTIREER